MYKIKKEILNTEYKPLGESGEMTLNELINRSYDFLSPLNKILPVAIADFPLITTFV
jgi:hypothetical protein